MNRQSKQLRSLALGIILSVGAGLIWAVVFGCGYGIISSIIRSGDVYEFLLFTHDGIPIIQSYMGNNYEAVNYRTLDGKPVEIDQDNILYSTHLSGPIYQRNKFFKPSWIRRIESVGRYWEGTERWFFICDDKSNARGYFVGYDRMACAKIGYIGINGFQSDETSREERFPVDVQAIYQWGSQGLIEYDYYGIAQQGTGYLLCEEGLVKFNLKKRSATFIRKQTNVISFDSTIKPKNEVDEKSFSGFVLLLRTPDQVLVLDSNGKTLQTYPLPEELRKEAFEMVLSSGNKAIVNHQNELFWIDSSGKVVERRHVDLRERWQASDTTDSVVTSTIMPSFGVIGGVFICYPWVPAESESLTYWAALNKGLYMYWPMFLITGIISVVLAVLCYRRQRRYGLPWTWVWTGFVLLFGLPAYLGYLAHRAWPARLPCPSCGERAPRDRQSCFVCNQDFPAPAPKGIEVFT